MRTPGRQQLDVPVLDVDGHVTLSSFVIAETVQVLVVVVFPVRVHLLVVGCVVFRLVGVLVRWGRLVLVDFLEFHFDGAGVFVADRDFLDVVLEVERDVGLPAFVPATPARQDRCAEVHIFEI